MCRGVVSRGDDAFDGAAFQDQADVEDLADILVGEGRDEVPRLGPLGDEPLGLQPGKRFAQGRAVDGQLCGPVRLSQPFALSDLLQDQQTAQAMVSLVAK